MAKEVLNQIRLAETKAEEIVRNAEESGRERMQQAQTDADVALKAAADQAKIQEAQICLAYQKKYEEEAAELKRAYEAEIAQERTLAEEKMDAAVEKILEGLEK